MAGRPSLYTAYLADEICRRLAEGEALVAICSEDEMPGYRTVFRWLSEREDFRQEYTRAKEIQGHYTADRAVMVAHEELDPQVARLRFDALRWHAGKLLPKVYGDKTLHTGGDGEGPVVVEIVKFGEGPAAE